MFEVADARKMLRFKDLEHVVLQDSNEPMVLISEMKSAGILEVEAPYPYLRESVWLQLQEAGQALQKSTQCGLKILYAYRPPEIQKHWYTLIYDRFAGEHPELSHEELVELTHSFVAVPSVAGHPTGAAVDITILGPNGEWDMGSDYKDIESKTIQTFAEGLTSKQFENRMFLREAMMAGGFAPFNGEWWHFSYGDREWAAFYSQPQASYGEVSVPGISIS